MKELIKKGLDFIKKNPSIVYSLILIVAVTGIIFFNSYYILGKLQESTNALLQKKAVLAEDILHTFVADSFENKELLQKKIEEIKEKDSEIKAISVLVPNSEKESFQVIASSDKENIGQEAERDLYGIAWNNKDRGIAYLNNKETPRFWDVAKVIENEGKKIGLTSLQLSLEAEDNFIDQKIKNVYLISLISVAIVLLLVINHARLFKYAVEVVKLEEVDKMKDEFISMASHELKTPLTALRGYIDLLREDVGKNDQNNLTRQLHYLENMGASVSRLHELVNDILEVSRIEQNRLPMMMQETALLPIVNNLIEEMRISANQKGLELIFEESKISAVWADPERIKQILVNLIGNAVKYTPKGKVEIKFKEDEKFVYLTVADTGLGISPEGLKNLFSKFFRVQTDDTRAISGTGLGLWISKQLALKMGGDITVESIEGVGSHFTLKIKKFSS